MDDFLTLGSDLFFKTIVTKIKSEFNFSKIEQNKFRFCGIDVDVTDEGIFIDQNEYTKAISEIPMDRAENPERPLTKDEFKLYRGATGKLIWLNEITRPDLSFDSLSLSYNNKSAKVKHILEANKIIKRQRRQIVL